MPRPLAPCGTYSAYRRHKRRGEEVDVDCRQAARDEANLRAIQRRRGVKPAPAADTAVEDGGPGAEITPLEDARDALRRIRKVMDHPETPPSALPGLSKERRALAALIADLEHGDSPHAATASPAIGSASSAAGGGFADEFSARRAARSADSA